MPNDVLKEYYKIALEKGLISTAKDSSDSKKKLEENPRVGSDTKEIIEKLYSFTRKDLDGNVTNKSWIEEAHPEPVVLFRAHDKLNGLLENDIERQRIILHQLKQKDLSLSKMKVEASKNRLIRNILLAASKLEDKDTKLSKIADGCSDLLLKQALAPLAIVLLTVLPVIAAAASSHMKPLANTLSEATVKLKEDLKDIYDSSVTLGFDYEYSDSFKNEALKIDKAITALNVLATKLLSGLENFSDDKKKQTADLYENFLSASSKVVEKFKEKQLQFKDPFFKQSVIKQSGVVQQTIDQVPYLHNPSGDWSLITSDFDELLQSFEVYIEKLSALKSKLQSMYDTAAGDMQSNELSSFDYEKPVDQKVEVKTPPQAAKKPIDYNHVLNTIQENQQKKTQNDSPEEDFRRIFKSK